MHLLIAGLLVRVGAQLGVVAGVAQHTRGGQRRKLAIWLEPTGRWEPKRACWRSPLAGGVYGEWLIGRSRGRRPCQGPIV
jgi:hypothetical protein